MMRRLWFAAVVASSLACGGDSSSGPEMGSVKFTRDANTCNGTPLAFTFFADGNTLGTATLASGASQTYPVATGTHIFSVQVTNSTLRFNPVTGAVGKDQTFLYLMTC